MRTFDMPSVRPNDDLRGALYDRTGMNFFVCEIDGEWHAGWFRIEDGKLEVSSETQSRTVPIVDPDVLTALLRKVLTEIVHESTSSPHPAQRREGQELLSVSLNCSTSDGIFSTDRAKEREQ